MRYWHFPPYFLGSAALLFGGTAAAARDDHVPPVAQASQADSAVQVQACLFVQDRFALMPEPSLIAGVKAEETSVSGSVQRTVFFGSRLRF